MPVQKGKSGLSAKLGGKLKQAVLAHKDDDLTLSGAGDLPPGIEGGVAQLVECKFDKYKTGDNTGEWYFYAAGIVKTPKEAGGIPVEGLRTSIMEPVCDTPGRKRESIEDHVAWVLNEYRKLGVDTKELSEDEFEDVAATLKEAKPHFRFRTWKGGPTKEFPNPRVNHEWRGLCEYNGQMDDAVIDETAEAPAEEPAAEESTAPWEKDDLTETGKAADGGDEDAQVKLAELAKAGGLDAEGYGTWAEVAAAIMEGGSAGEAAPEPAAEFTPEKGEVYMWKPPKAKKAVEVEVTAVFPSSKKVNLKNLDDGKSIKAISWDALEQG